MTDKKLCIKCRFSDVELREWPRVPWNQARCWHKSHSAGWPREYVTGGQMTAVRPLRYRTNRRGERGLREPLPQRIVPVDAVEAVEAQDRRVWVWCVGVGVGLLAWTCVVLSLWG